MVALMHEDAALMNSSPDRPTIALSAHLEGARAQLREAYLDRVWAAGGLPVTMAALSGSAGAVADRVAGVILTGGDDPDMRFFGESLHPKATLIDPRRQVFEIELLKELDRRPEIPVLGICLGMQMMGLAGGGRLDQYLPDSLATADDHWNGAIHPVSGPIGEGLVHSHHRQALTDPGRYVVTGTSPDGVIEAIADPTAAFRIGVQWHPERTDDPLLGAGLFERLVEAARACSDIQTRRSDP